MPIHLKAIVAPIILAATIGLSLMSTSAAQRSIPEDNLAYPVFITISDGQSTGSGFFLNAPKATYLVTAKHVLFDPSSHRLRGQKADLLSYSRDLTDPGRNLIELDLPTLERDGRLRAHSSEDIAVVELATVVGDAAQDAAAVAGAKRDISTVPGTTIKEMTASGITGMTTSMVKTFDKVLTGNEVLVYGYPTSIGLKELSQLDPLRPLLRKGLVAGQNPRKHSIVLDAMSYPGNSGGPVIQIEVSAFQREFFVIGVVSEFVPFDIRSQFSQLLLNSGYSIATPMDFVLELIK
jgi:hypothetical protein